MDRDSYDSAVERIREYIARGRTYQVNYTMRLRAAFDAEPWEFFLQLAQTQNQHGAYIDTGRYVICSASPELFFTLDGETITCRPMKGTVKRGRTTTEDQAQADWLQSSEKNRAENVMIVDMIRNDLGRIAKTGSVQRPGIVPGGTLPHPLADDIHSHCQDGRIHHWNIDFPVPLCLDHRRAQGQHDEDYPCAGDHPAPDLYRHHWSFLTRTEGELQRGYTNGIDRPPGTQGGIWDRWRHHLGLHQPG